MNLEPRYIGDGVYIQVDQEDPTRLILTTNSHKLMAADAIVYLELREARALMIYMRDFIIQFEGEQT